MSNIAKILKDDIQRITKNELKSVFKELKQSTSSLEKTVKQLSNRITALEKGTKPSPAPKKKISVKTKSRTLTKDTDNITAQDIIKLRKRLDLSQHKFAKLVKGSQARISSWEKQKGNVRITNNNVKGAILGLMRKFK